MLPIFVVYAEAYYIIELSVYHWIDPTYKDLKRHIDTLKSKCNDTIFLELISPPLEGDITEAHVNEIVGSEPVYRYKHKIRKMRSLYIIKADS